MVKLQIICAIINLLAALAILVGVMLCGVNVIMQLFGDARANLTQAMAGFIMTVVGSVTSGVLSTDSKN